MRSDSFFGLNFVCFVFTPFPKHPSFFCCQNILADFEKETHRSSSSSSSSWTRFTTFRRNLSALLAPPHPFHTFRTTTQWSTLGRYVEVDRGRPVGLSKRSPKICRKRCPKYVGKGDQNCQRSIFTKND